AAIKQRAEGRRSVADLPMLQSELERIRRKGQEANERTARRWASPEFLESSRNIVRSTVERMTKGSPIQEGSAAWNEIADKVIMATLLPSNSIQQGDETTPLGETITQAADAWFAELERTDIRPQTLDGHRLRVRAFVEHAGDTLVASVSRAIAADWLTKIAHGRSNRTVNAYSVTMRALFDSAKQRGRFTGENPFSGQKRKAGGEA